MTTALRWPWSRVSGWASPASVAMPTGRQRNKDVPPSPKVCFRNASRTPTPRESASTGTVARRPRGRAPRRLHPVERREFRKDPPGSRDRPPKLRRGCPNPTGGSSVLRNGLATGEVLAPSTLPGRCSHDASNPRTPNIDFCKHLG